MTSTNPFDHVIYEFRIKPDDMPTMSTPSTAPSYSSIYNFQKLSTTTPCSSIPTKLNLVTYPWSSLKKNSSNQTRINQSLNLPTQTCPSTNPNSSIKYYPSPEDSSFNTIETIRAFTFQQQIYLKYVATKTALRNLILNTIDDKEHQRVRE